MNPGAGANRALRGWRSVWALGIGLIAGPALLVGTPALASDSFGPSSPVAATAPLAKSAPVAAGQPATDQAIWGDPSVLRPAPAAGSALAVSAGRLLVLRPDGVLESRALDGSERASVRLAVLPGLAATALFPTQDGVLIVGTSAKTGGYQAHYLGLRAGQGPVVALPPLPAGFVLTAATAVGSTVFLADAAGATLRFDLAAASAPGAPAGQWAALGRAPMHCDRTWLSHQYDGTAERLFAACLDRAAGAIEVARWDERGGWTAGGKTTVADPVLTVAPHGQSNLLALTSAAGQAGQVLVYNTVIKRWRALATHYPNGAPPMMLAHDGQIDALVVDGGQPALRTFGFAIPAKRFGWLDMSVIAVYLAAMILVGLWFKARNTSTEEFFRGGQSIPWWAAALSIHAALLSSLTYLGLPALVYRTSWIMFPGMIILILITPVIVYGVMPFFRRIDATSAYEYLSMRFNMPIRWLASSLFVLFHVGRVAIVLSLASLALASVTPLAAWQSVVLMGVLSIAYSTLGGVEAVIWTEALQTLVLSTGALICLYFLLHGIDGGFTHYLHQGLADNKFQLIDWNFSHGSWMTFSIWVVVLGGIGQNLSTYGADQAVIQRYLVTSSEKKAASSIWLNAVTTAPSGIIFFLIGTGLYYFYQSHPDRLDPSIQIDQIFPTFIANEVPTGLAGLIVAGVFAATQSAVATSMHSISTALVVDFLRPSGVTWSDTRQLAAARWFTVMVGAIGTCTGLVFINPAIRSLFEAYMAVIGMSMGALGGLFLAGMATRRVNSLAAFLGLAAGVAIMVALWRTNAINPYLYSAVGVFACFGLSLLFSLVTGPSRNNLDGLTVLTLNRPPAKEAGR